MTYEGNKRESKGYNVIMGLVRMDDFTDPYETGRRHLFAMEEVLFAITGETPSGYAVGTPEDLRKDLASDHGHWPDVEYFGFWIKGDASTADFLRACAIMHRYVDWAKIWRDAQEL